METKPKVVLISWGKDGKELASLAWRVMQEDIEEELESFMSGKGIDCSKFNDLKKEALGTPLEFIPMVWYISNVSRGFTHQLVRHRVGWSFAQQSMRVVPKEQFYTKGQYHTPPNCKNKEDYDKAMQKIEEEYGRLIKAGEDAEVARGILPTNIHTTIMASTNYRAWHQMAVQRMCSRVQGEFKQVVAMMIQEVKNKMGKDFADVMAPCEYDARCMIPSQWEKCGKEKTKDGRVIVHD